MPWLYLDVHDMKDARLTDDDGEDVALVSSMRIDYSSDPFGVVEGTVSLELIITDDQRAQAAFGYPGI